MFKLLFVDGNNLLFFVVCSFRTKCLVTVRDLKSDNIRGFYFLNVTQFLGAANDNILKNILVYGVAVGGLWDNQLGPGGQAWASMALSIPFVLLSGFAGQFSDKFSKRDVSIVSKWSEILIAVVAAVGLLYHYPQAHYCLGVALHRIGEIDRAVEALRPDASVE